MNNAKKFRFEIVASVLIATTFAVTAPAQQNISKVPTAADWAALAKLPDFNGVWERAGVGGSGNPAFGTAPAAPRGNQPPGGNRGAAPQRGARGDGGGGAAAGGRGGAPSFTPQYEAMRAAAARSPQPEDNNTANCLPPGMPGIMTQPYPMEFLMTPGKVTIIIEAYTQVRHIYTDGRPLPKEPDPKFFKTSIGR